MFTPSHPALLPTLDTDDTDEVKREAKLAAKRKAGLGTGKKRRKQNARENTRANGESLRNLVFKWSDN